MSVTTTYHKTKAIPTLKNGLSDSVRNFCSVVFLLLLTERADLGEGGPADRRRLLPTLQGRLRRCRPGHLKVLSRFMPNGSLSCFFI